MANSKSAFNENFEILRKNLMSSSHDEHFSEDSDLRPIEEIPHPYQQIFSEYSGFNRIQSKILDDVLYTDDSLVISAPTGAGKTAIFELAITRLLINTEFQNTVPFKMVYIAPMKAICEERVTEWHKKFSNFGINSISITGDSDNVDFNQLLNHNLIITTPEKWDCLTRRWRENLKLVEAVKLFLIDEIHLLNEESRGSSLETIVCRMKTVQEAIYNCQSTKENMRLIAVSATVPNIEDVAEWIGDSTKCYKFSDDFRPVKLNKIVIGYTTSPNSSPFKFDMSLNYKLQGLLMKYSNNKPTLIFCGTRKIVEMTARHLLQNLTINLKPEQKEKLMEAAASISDSKLRETVIHGVGYHHAGMLPHTRKTIENLFRNGELPILVATGTLAMGVNLPAHLVIVKSTKCYCNGSFRDYSETALLQMIGRAGRPQYDSQATALILTTSKDKQKFEKMIDGRQPIESDLHKHLIEHLNAEVVLQTITDLGAAMRWLSSTFLYVRAKKNPRYYGITSSDSSATNRKLLEMCQIELNKLIKAGMITIDEDLFLKTTPIGTAMAKYYLAFNTMKLFTEIKGDEILQQILALISKCHEFSENYLRVNDKKCLNLLNKCRSGKTIRFPLTGKIKTVDMKINCVFQAVLGCLDIGDHSLLIEALKIMRNGERIVNCLVEYLETKENNYKALLSTIILAKCFKVQLWENSPYVSKLLPGIGKVMSAQLVNAGKTTFESIAESDPRHIEYLLNKKPPAGTKIVEFVQHLPKYEMNLDKLNKNKAKLTITLTNYSNLEKKCSVNKNSKMILIVGDSSNNLLLYEKFSHSFFIENNNFSKYFDYETPEIEADLISDDWVGIDCKTKLESEQKQVEEKQKKDNNLTYMQTFMEMYMKCKQNENKENVENNNQTEKTTNKNSKIIIHGNVTIVEGATKENVRNSEFEAIQEVAQKDDFSWVKEKFEFTPKKLGNKRHICDEEPTEKIENKLNKSQKITWRSPLTYSPPVKFSPKLNLTCVSDNRTPLEVERKKAKLSLTPRTPLKTLIKTQTQTLMPLSDKSAADSVSSIDGSFNSKEVLEKVGDVVSPSFLKSCGLIPETSEYYDRLMSQKIDAKESWKPKQVSPFCPKKEAQKTRSITNYVNTQSPYFTKHQSHDSTDNVPSFDHSQNKELSKNLKTKLSFDRESDQPKQQFSLVDENILDKTESFKKETESDPFNDSFNTLFMDYDTSPQNFEETQNKRQSFEDFNEVDSLKCEDLFEDPDLRSHLYQNAQPKIQNINFDEMTYQTKENFQNEGYQHNFDLSFQRPDFTQNEFYHNNYGKQNSNFGANVSFYRPNPIEHFQNFYTPSPSQNLESFDSGYAYLRRTMERDDPYLQPQNSYILNTPQRQRVPEYYNPEINFSYVGNIDYQTVGQITPSTSQTPLRPRVFMTGYNEPRPQFQESFYSQPALERNLQFPYQEASFCRQTGVLDRNIPRPQFQRANFYPQIERNNPRPQFHDVSFCPPSNITEKNYVMQKFFNSMGSNY